MDKGTLLHVTSTVHSQLKDAKANDLAEKALDLVDKIQSQTFVIGFAGHFSAGKSSMINNLLEEEILPTSPIPTSANLVQVQKGNGIARVHFNDEDPVEISEPYDIDTLKSLCKEGDSIKDIQLQKSRTNLPEHITILDTPGIDSSNDADRVITESAIHTIDILIYVMDYNHVQSEVNLAFLQEMQRKGKRLYIVINQMDKHEESELSFTAFKQSIYQAFTSWKIDPLDIFFTSLVNEEHPLNEINRLKETIWAFMKQKEKFVEDTVYYSLKAIVETYLNAKEQATHEHIEEIREHLEQLGEESAAEKELEEQRRYWNQLPEEAKDEMWSSLQKSLQNAYIMPHDVREKAKLYVESMQSGFKVGFLFGKKKTEEEREQRLQNFFDDLNEKVQANMEGPVRKQLVQVAKQFDVADESILQSLQGITITFTKEDIANLLKSGAGAGGDYVLVFTKDIAAELKKRFKQEAQKEWEQVTNVLRDKQEHALQRLQHRSEQLSRKYDLEDKIEKLVQEKKEEHRRWESILKGNNIHSDAYENATQALIQRDARFTTLESIHAISYKTKGEEDPKQEKSFPSIAPLENKSIHNVERAAESLLETHDIIADLNGFDALKNQLLEKRERMVSRHFTVALFGAFSAGKSSFANALLGENVLPVSPNPTTATINKISPVTEDVPHGTVEIRVKSDQQLVEDIRYAIKPYTIKADTVQTAIPEISRLYKEDSLERLDQKRFSFIQALQSGFGLMKSHIGSSMRVTLEEFAPYVSEESKSCFIEWINVHYECEVTNKGITLVDTPGADSVNARHTEVSFEYIRNADAILFVTYYNHPFSRADKEFLTQLGRVKDAFSMDKMFFMINAADLAQSSADLTLVKEYMREQLTQFGIRNPRLFPVSSLMAMKEKQGRQEECDSVLSGSGLPAFEEAFYDFINKDLTNVMVSEAWHDMERVKQTLQNVWETSKAAQEDKERNRLKIQEQHQQAQDVLNQFDSLRYKQALEQKVNKQLFHIVERIMLQFSDRFKEYINPSTIQGTSAEAKHSLQQEIMNLLDQVGNDVMQEIRAVTIRIERFIEEQLQEVATDIERKMQQVKKNISFTSTPDNEMVTPLITTPFQDVGSEHFSKELGTFKNTKSFFEENQKERLKEQLQIKTKGLINRYMKGEEKRFIDYYTKEFDQSLHTLKQHISSSLDDYVQGTLFYLEEEGAVQTLHNKVDSMDALITQMR
ncbi:dynamin family protein [Pontibacillus salicampi]|uniref:Dynamin family protein n=1 Tax=Pontibacillus salicampi TaxID=1449801 RepID=A0ABV6LLT5_9BACI